MLFYERVGDHSSYDDDSDAKVPDDIFELIWEDNTDFLQDKNLFDTKFFEFLWKTLHTIQVSEENMIRHDLGDLSLKTVKVASLFLIHTMSHAKDNNDLK